MSVWDIMVFQRVRGIGFLIYGHGGLLCRPTSKSCWTRRFMVCFISFDIFIDGVLYILCKSVIKILMSMVALRTKDKPFKAKAESIK